MSADALTARLAALGAQFRAALPEQLATLRAAAAAGDIVTVHAQAHRLAGRAGTFGQVELGNVAAQLEAASTAPVDLNTVDALLDRLAHLANRTA